MTARIVEMTGEESIPILQQAASAWMMQLRSWR